MTTEAAESAGKVTGIVAPARRGSRDERRAAALAAFSTGQPANCAYCSQELPPLPSRGGRPSPYCPADPERYGQWGAKVISCAMLDENREIWVQVYGADQPMTQVDVAELDQRLATLLAALDPVRDEVSAFHVRVSRETAAALAAQEAAQAACEDARQQVQLAVNGEQRAVADAAEARAQATAALAGQHAAKAAAAAAENERAQALAAQQLATEAKAAAETDRQQALAQLSAAQDQVTGLQATLASERATALEQVDQLRQQQEQARQQLRMELAAKHGELTRQHAAELNEQLAHERAQADQRLRDLTAQLTAATSGFADTLGNLHQANAALQAEAAQQTKTTGRLERQLAVLRDGLELMAHEPGTETGARQLLAAAGIAVSTHEPQHRPSE